jgi:hypothetical protein
VLTLKLGDGRGSGDIGFSDLVNICKGEEEGEGTALEKAWGMSSAPAAVAVVKKGGAKPKKPKKKKR